MNRLDSKKRAQVIAALVEGCSIRSTVRMTGVAKNTVTKLLVEVGAACSKYQDEAFRDLNCKRIQVDEIWMRSGASATPNRRTYRLRSGISFGYGDVWTWTAIEA